MTSSIILKKSSVASRVPVVGDLAYGELALNYADGALYYKRSDNTIQNLISAGGVSSFNTRTGAITLTSGDVTDALGYTPLSAAGGTISGNVGINIAAGSTPLDVNHVGTLTYGIRVGDNATVSNNTGIYLRTTGTATIAWGAGGNLVFATSGGSVTRFSIGSSGQLGIGASESFGTAGQVLTSGGSSAAPTWTTPSSGGSSTVMVDKGTVASGTVAFTASASGYQRLQVGGALTITTTGWPTANTYGELMIELVNGASAAITWPTINWIKGDGTVTTTFGANGVSLQVAGTDFILLWTRNGGTTIYGKIIR